MVETSDEHSHMYSLVYFTSIDRSQPHADLLFMLTRHLSKKCVHTYTHNTPFPYKSGCCASVSWFERLSMIDMNGVLRTKMFSLIHLAPN